MSERERKYEYNTVSVPINFRPHLEVDVNGRGLSRPVVQIASHRWAVVDSNAAAKDGGEQSRPVEASHRHINRLHAVSCRKKSQE